MEKDDTEENKLFHSLLNIIGEMKENENLEDVKDEYEDLLKVKSTEELIKDTVNAIRYLLKKQNDSELTVTEKVKLDLFQQSLESLYDLILTNPRYANSEIIINSENPVQDLIYSEVIKFDYNFYPLIYPKKLKMDQFINPNILGTTPPVLYNPQQPLMGTPPRQPLSNYYYYNRYWSFQQIQRQAYYQHFHPQFRRYPYPIYQPQYNPWDYISLQNLQYKMAECTEIRHSQPRRILNTIARNSAQKYLEVIQYESYEKYLESRQLAGNYRQTRSPGEEAWTFHEFTERCWQKTWPEQTKTDDATPYYSGENNEWNPTWSNDTSGAQSYELQTHLQNKQDPQNYIVLSDYLPDENKTETRKTIDNNSTDKTNDTKNHTIEIRNTNSETKTDFTRNVMNFPRNQMNLPNNPVNTYPIISSNNNPSNNQINPPMNPFSNPNISGNPFIRNIHRNPLDSCRNFIDTPRNPMNYPKNVIDFPRNQTTGFSRNQLMENSRAQIIDNLKNTMMENSKISTTHSDKTPDNSRTYYNNRNCTSDTTGNITNISTSNNYVDPSRNTYIDPRNFMYDRSRINVSHQMNPIHNNTFKNPIINPSRNDISRNSWSSIECHRFKPDLEGSKNITKNISTDANECKNQEVNYFKNFPELPSRNRTISGSVTETLSLGVTTNSDNSRNVSLNVSTSISLEASEIMDDTDNNSAQAIDNLESSAMKETDTNLTSPETVDVSELKDFNDKTMVKNPSIFKTIFKLSKQAELKTSRNPVEEFIDSVETTNENIRESESLREFYESKEKGFENQDVYGDGYETQEDDYEYNEENYEHFEDFGEEGNYVYQEDYSNGTEYYENQTFKKPFHSLEDSNVLEDYPGTSFPDSTSKQSRKKIFDNFPAWNKKFDGFSSVPMFSDLFKKHETIVNDNKNFPKLPPGLEPRETPPNEDTIKQILFGTKNKSSDLPKKFCEVLHKNERILKIDDFPKLPNKQNITVELVKWPMTEMETKDWWEYRNLDKSEDISWIRRKEILESYVKEICSLQTVQIFSSIIEQYLKHEIDSGPVLYPLHYPLISTNLNDYLPTDKPVYICLKPRLMETISQDLPFFKNNADFYLFHIKMSGFYADEAYNHLNYICELDIAKKHPDFFKPHGRIKVSLAIERSIKNMNVIDVDLIEIWHRNEFGKGRWKYWLQSFQNSFKRFKDKFDPDVRRSDVGYDKEFKLDITFDSDQKDSFEKIFEEFDKYKSEPVDGTGKKIEEIFTKWFDHIKQTQPKYEKNDNIHVKSCGNYDFPKPDHDDSKSYLLPRELKSEFPYSDDRHDNNNKKYSEAVKSAVKSFRLENDDPPQFFNLNKLAPNCSSTMRNVRRSKQENYPGPVSTQAKMFQQTRPEGEYMIWLCGRPVFVPRNSNLPEFMALNFDWGSYWQHFKAHERMPYTKMFDRGIN